MSKSTRLMVIENIKHFRKLNNLTTQELSKRINKKYNFIEMLEANLCKREPTIDTIDKIAKVLNISVSNLVNDESANE